MIQAVSAPSACCEAMQYAVCSMQCAVCSMQCAARSVQYAACSMQFAVCSMHCALCIMHCKPQLPCCNMIFFETPVVTNFGFVYPFPPPATACAALSLVDRWCDPRVTSIYNDARIYAAVSTPVRAELSCVISDGEPQTQSTAEKASCSTV